MTPTEFEQMVARIIELLAGIGWGVEWNTRIPDPDNEKQSRQIDIAQLGTPNAQLGTQLGSTARDTQGKRTARDTQGKQSTGHVCIQSQ